MIARTKMNPIKKNHDAVLRTGAMALAAAGASTAAHAATVQITFQNSFVSTTSGIAALDTDVGGDLIADLVGIVAANPYGAQGWVYRNQTLRDQRALVGRAGGGLYGASALLGGDVTLETGVSLAVREGLVAFTLVDTVVNGGAPTAGWLDVTATGRSPGELGRVDVHRFIFDDTGLGAPTGVAHADAAYPEYGAVPEPSGLGLLALGAGGLLARRRRAMAA